MKLLGRKKDETAASEETDAATPDDDIATSSASRGSRTTAPKGRPTPKRSDRRRGPVAPAPMTAAEARARRKSLAGPKLSREERKAQSAARRAQMSQRRERMMAGDEAYLLPRDQGPVRRFVRDVVDSRRNVMGLFMPSALGLMFVMFAVPQLQLYMSPAMMALMVLMVIDGVILGRKVSRLVDEKFPDNTESRWKLGLYAAGRASQLRRMRAPRPQVKRGSKVT
ncbi:DUF3043 domain-containing protein [Mycobacterium celatum]|uniref:DUF3043 domain-containing protein n=2 Tax=Mycobacterium celatum TaxID=28045 RepID=A0A1X1RR31_MYCCE|nr:DUF3043 domain-containing protein [Mycobacterium celatum]ORV12675.1 hypothetical protein AWB95_12250 [Mycobacterium celatum]PIB80951.1 DUF3043 domain-containing protein [Mycobacterium celatum]